MSCATLAVVVVAFLAGYGWAKAEKSVLAFIFDREESPVRSIARWIGKVFGHRTTISTWTVILSLAISGVVGYVEIRQGKSDTARTNCSIEFNRLSATARDDRVNAQVIALQAQVDQVRGDITYQHRLRGTLLTTHPTLHELIQTFDDKIADDKHLVSKLVHQQAVSAAHAYPPPDFCEGR